MSNYNYWDKSIITVMVPVKVKYHEPTDVVFSFEAPTISDIEKALRDRDNKTCDTLCEYDEFGYEVSRGKI